MKKIFLLLSAILLLLSTGMKASEDWQNVGIYTNDKKHTLAEYKGKVVLVMFWATWCPYCKAQIPAISMLKTLYSSAKDFEVVTISTDFEGEDKVKNYLNTYNLNNLTSYVDMNSKLLHSFGFSAIPTLILISRDGKVLGSYSGLQHLDVNYLERVIKEGS